LAKVASYCQTRMIPTTVNPAATVTGACLTSAVDERAGKELIVNVSYTYPFIVFPNITKLFGGNMGTSLVMNAETIMRCE
jgi:hypothetical protein